MGKYIIDLESGTHIFMLGPEGIVHIGEPDVVYETVDGMQIGDAVINAKPYTEPDLEQVKKKAYAEGFKDGQYAERNGLVANYAQKQEEIKVGDEVIAASGKAVIIDINDDKDKARYIYSDSTLGFDNICNLSKTGRHFPEIASVLEKMRGEQDG